MRSTAKHQFKAEAVAHIGVVVKDVRKVAEIWESEWGIGNWTFGQGKGYRVGITVLGSIMFELYQPVEGEPISEGMAQAVPLYKDFLKKWGDGIHHIAFTAGDVLEEVLDLLFVHRRQIIQQYEYQSTQSNRSRSCR